MKEISKYEALEQLKLRINNHIATMDEEMQYINRELKAARAETVHEVDVTLITARNQFFSIYFTADFVVMEDNVFQIIPILTISTLDKTFHPGLPYLWGLC